MKVDNLTEKTMNKTETSILNWFDLKAPVLLKKDPRTFSVKQLFNLVLGSAQDEHIDLISSLMKVCNDDLHRLRNIPIENFKRLGLSFREVDCLLAVLELIKRGVQEDENQVTIQSSADAFKVMRSKLNGLNHEEFWIMIMNRANRLVGQYKISSGGVSGTVVDSKLVFLKLIQFGASSVIFVHNHPSGNLKPSQADIKLTEKLKKAGDFLDIVVLDHLILSGDNYFSFADEGLIVPR